MDDKSLAIKPSKQKRQGYLVATNIKEARDIAEMISGTDFLPKSYREKQTKKPKISEVIIAGNMGARHGWDMLQSVQAICVINNRPCIWGEYFWGLILSAPEYKEHRETYDPDIEGGQWTVTIWKKGSDIPVVGTFSIQDASNAGLLSAPDKAYTWGKYPKDMCLWRARSRAGKSGFSHVIQGFDMVEVMRDTVDVTYKVLDNKDQSRTEKLKADLKGKEELPESGPGSGEVVDAGSPDDNYGEPTGERPLPKLQKIAKKRPKRAKWVPLSLRTKRKR
jgi:hypothetical protein